MLLPLKIRNLSVLVSEIVLDFQPIACILMVSWDKLRTRSLFVLKPVSGWPSVHPPEVTPVGPTSVGLLLPLRQPRLWSRATFGPHALFEAANHSSFQTVNSSFTPRTLLKSVSQCTLNLCSLPRVMMPVSSSLQGSPCPLTLASLASNSVQRCSWGPWGPLTVFTSMSIFLKFCFLLCCPWLLNIAGEINKLWPKNLGKMWLFPSWKNLQALSLPHPLTMTFHSALILYLLHCSTLLSYKNNVLFVFL